jgi:hypothetical protein
MSGTASGGGGGPPGWSSGGSSQDRLSRASDRLPGASASLVV